MSVDLKYGQIEVGTTICADYDWKHAIGVFLQQVRFANNTPINQLQGLSINFGEFGLALHRRTKTVFAYLNVESQTVNLPPYVSANSIIALHGQDCVVGAMVNFVVSESTEQLCIQLPCRGWIWLNKKGQRDPLEAYWVNLPTSGQLVQELPDFRKTIIVT